MDLCPHCHVLPLYEYKLGRGQRRVATTCGQDLCLRSKRAEYQRGRRRVRPKPDRTYGCGGCGAIILVPSGTYNGRRSLCDSCRQIGSSVERVLRRTTDEQYLCAGCEKPFTRTATKGQRPRWCPECSNGRGWRRANRDLVNNYNRVRDARLRDGEAEVFLPVEIFERDGWRCQIPGCGRLVRREKTIPHPLAPTLDHILPVSLGGRHLRANVRCAHYRCNIVRGNRGGNDQLLLIG